MVDQTILQYPDLVGIDPLDWVLGWDTSSGTTVRMRRDRLVGGTITGGGSVATGGFTLTVPATGVAAVLGVAQTWTAAQTIPRLGLNDYTMVVNEILLLGYRPGLVLLWNSNTGSQMLAFSGLAVVQIALTGTNISTTKDTASQLNIFVEGGQTRIQNLTGVVTPILYGFFAN